MHTQIYSKSQVEKFLQHYLPTVEHILGSFSIPSINMSIDHLGCLAHNPQEFDQITDTLLSYSNLIKEITLSGRRVRVFKFHESVQVGTYQVPKIEIFEPKPGIDISTLRYGIEHVSFYVSNWEDFISQIKPLLPVAKEGTVNTSFFIKTEIINTIEIEFRSDRLGEESVK